MLFHSILCYAICSSEVQGAPPPHHHSWCLQTTRGAYIGARPPWKVLSKQSRAMECCSHPASCLFLAWTQPGSFAINFMEKGQLCLLLTPPSSSQPPQLPSFPQPKWLLFPSHTTRGAPMSLRCLWMLSIVRACSMAVLLQGCARSVVCWQWQNNRRAEDTSGSSLLWETKQKPC